MFKEINRAANARAKIARANKLFFKFKFNKKIYPQKVKILDKNIDNMLGVLKDIQDAKDTMILADFRKSRIIDRIIKRLLKRGIVFDSAAFRHELESHSLTWVQTYEIENDKKVLLR